MSIYAFYTKIGEGETQDEFIVSPIDRVTQNQENLIEYLLLKNKIKNDFFIMHKFFNPIDISKNWVAAKRLKNKMFDVNYEPQDEF